MTMTNDAPISITELHELRSALNVRAPVRPVIWCGQAGYGKRQVPLRAHERLLLGLAPLIRRWLAPDEIFHPKVYDAEPALEVQRLRVLNALGWLVPEVLAAEREVFVTADAGPTLAALLAAEPNPEIRAAWLNEGARDLAEFHQAGQWHGAAQVRNLVRTRDGRLGRIDFETALDRHFPLPLLQAFDAALYFTSIARLRDGHLLPSIARTYLEHAPESARAALRRGLPLIRWLARSRLVARLSPKEAERLRAIAALPLD